MKSGMKCQFPSFCRISIYSIYISLETQFPLIGQELYTFGFKGLKNLG